MSGTGLFLGQRELLHSERERAITEAWPVTDRRVYPMPFIGTVRHPYTSSLTPTKHPEMTSVEIIAKAARDEELAKAARDEELAKAASERLKQCDDMHAELERLRNFEKLVINIRAEQQEGLLDTNALLPAPPPGAPKPRRTAKHDKEESSIIQQLGGRRRKTRRKRRRRKKTKRIKRPN